MHGLCGTLISEMGDARSPAQAHSSGRIYNADFLFPLLFWAERSGVEESQFMSLVPSVPEMLRLRSPWQEQRAEDCAPLCIWFCGRTRHSMRAELVIRRIQRSWVGNHCANEPRDLRYFFPASDTDVLQPISNRVFWSRRDCRRRNAPQGLWWIWAGKLPMHRLRLEWSRWAVRSWFRPVALCD